MPFFPPHDPYGLDSDRTRSTAVRTGWLIVGRMTLPEKLAESGNKKGYAFKFHRYTKNYVNLLNIPKSYHSVTMTHTKIEEHISKGIKIESTYIRFTFQPFTHIFYPANELGILWAGECKFERSRVYTWSFIELFIKPRMDDRLQNNWKLVVIAWQTMG